MTAIHRLVESCRAGTYPPLVGRLDSGWLVMGERQVLPGYCLLLPDPVVADLNELQGEARRAFMTHMGVIGDALLAVTGAVRINYAIFGNVEPALHAHLFPRHADEPEGLRSVQPWALNWQAAPSFSSARHDGFKILLRQELQRRQLLR